MDEPFDPTDPMGEDDTAKVSKLRLELLGKTLVEKRDDAVKARAASGIEAVWMSAEEAYLGIDDLNRSEWTNAKWAKPTSMQGPVTVDQVRKDDNKSTVFVPLTSRYVDAGHAKVCEILPPIDDKPFGFDPSPVPELIAARNMLKAIMKNGGEVTAEMAAAFLPQPQAPGAAPPGAPSAGPAPNPAPGASPPPGAAPPPAGPAPILSGGQPPAPPAPPAPGAIGGPVPDHGIPVADLLTQAKRAVEVAQDAAKRAEMRVYDWLVEAKHPSEMRKVLFDGARIGVGILKGPFADSRTDMAVTTDEQGNVALQINQTVAPGVSWIDPWDFFPDGACGEEVNNGDHTFERKHASQRKLKDLKKLPGYLGDAIDKVLKEGPSKCYVDEQGQSNPALQNDQESKDRRFALWHFYGVVAREDFMALPDETRKQVGADTLDASVEDIYVVATLVNDTIIRMVLNPLDSGRFPYRVFPWRRRAGHWAGVGVAEQVDAAQRMCNAATRATMNNAGQSAGTQIIVDIAGIVPADQKWVITPNKIWYKTADSTMDDVRKAFAMVEMPNQTDELMKIIEFSFKVAEDSCNIPLISQGQSGKTTPDTFGGQQLQNNNANQLLRSIGALCDDTITEPLVRDFYEWLLLDPDVPNDEKGDFKINAHGSSALVERAIQDQTFQQLVQPALNPAYGLDPEMVMTEFLKSKRIDPRSCALSDEKKQQMQQQQQPKAPAVEAAQIRADAMVKTAEMNKEVQETRIKVDTDRDTVYTNSEATRNQQDQAIRMQELQVEKDLAILKYATQQKVSLEQVKAELAKESMRLNVQKELAGVQATLDLHKHHNPAPVSVEEPPVQLPGRAPDGHAFSQV